MIYCRSVTFILQKVIFYLFYCRIRNNYLTLTVFKTLRNIYPPLNFNPQISKDYAEIKWERGPGKLAEIFICCNSSNTDQISQTAQSWKLASFLAMNLGRS